MNVVKNIAGKILHAISQLLSIVLDVIIGFIEVIVTLVSSIARGILAFLGMGGCLLYFFFAGPIGIALLMNPMILVTLLFFIIFPILGTNFISFLKYVKYMITEYLFDRANNLMHGANNRYQSFFEYGTKYRKEEEAKRQKEQDQRRSQQQKEWEERFRQWQSYQNSHRTNNGYGGFGNNGQPFLDPSIEFKQKYEKYCNFLGIGYDADKYQVKLAYRKKAKEYHPDINKSPNATKMFQQINDAYEFLSEENIVRYKSMKMH